MSLWYRTGGTRNWKWRIVSPDDKDGASILYRAGYTTVEADCRPEVYLPDEATPGAYSTERIAAAKPALEAAVARAILSPEALVDLVGGGGPDK